MYYLPRFPQKSYKDKENWRQEDNGWDTGKILEAKSLLDTCLVVSNEAAREMLIKIANIHKTLIMVPG